MTKKEYLRNIAYTKIKEMILKGQLEGPFISENELVNILGISRTPIRDALQKLQYEKFIEIIPKKGVFLREVSLKESNDLMDVRLAVEIFSMKQLTNQLSEDHVLELDAKVEVQEEMIQKNDIYNFISEDIAYHLFLLDIVGNEYFIEVINHITNRLFHHGMEIFKKNPLKMKSSVEDHKKINNCLRKNEFKKAIQLMQRHILKGKGDYMSQDITDIKGI